jgi:hypothetical protein
MRDTLHLHKDPLPHETRRQNTRKCFYCGKENHVAWNCYSRRLDMKKAQEKPKDKREKQKFQGWCDYCEMHGHRTESCRKKKKVATPSNANSSKSTPRVSAGEATKQLSGQGHAPPVYKTKPKFAKKTAAVGARFRTVRGKQHLPQCDTCGLMGHVEAKCQRTLADKIAQQKQTYQRVNSKQVRQKRKIASLTKNFARGSWKSKTATFQPRTDRITLEEIEELSKKKCVPRDELCRTFNRSRDMASAQVIRNKKLRSFLRQWKRVTEVPEPSCKDYTEKRNQVYIVFDMKTGHMYVGATKSDLVTRMQQHFTKTFSTEATTLTKYFNSVHGDVHRFLTLPLMHLDANQWQNQTQYETNAIAYFKPFLNMNQNYTAGRTGKSRPPPRHRERRDSNVDLTQLPKKDGLLKKLMDKPVGKRNDFICSLKKTKLLCLMNCVRGKQADETYKDVYQQIAQRVRSLTKVPRQTFTFTSRFLTEPEIILQNVFMSKEVKGKWPFAISELENLKIQFKTLPTLAMYTFNFTEVAHLEEEPTCTCKETIKAMKSNGEEPTLWDGHLVGTAKEITETLKMTKAADLLQAGSKFRFTQSNEECKKTFEIDLKKMVHSFGKTMQDDMGTFANVALQRFSELVDTTKREDEVMYDAKTMKSIKELKENFVFVPVDKTPQTLGMVCKHYYWKEVQKAMDGDQFENSTEIALEKAKDKANEMMPQRKPSAEVQYVYVTPKFHKMDKTKPAWRTVSGSKGEKAMNFMKKQSQRLGDLLRGVIDTMMEKANMLFKKDKVMRAMLNPDTNHIMKMMEGWNNLPLKMRGRTFDKTDFSALYPSLKANKVKGNLARLTEQAFTHVAAQRNVPPGDLVYQPVYFDGKAVGTQILVRNDPAVDQENSYSKAKIKELICFVIDNTFTRNGKRVCRQTGGVGIGVASSSDAANGCLFMDEWDNMEQILANGGERAKRARLQHGYVGCGRYVDDNISLSEYSWMIPSKEKYGLEYSSKEDKAECVVYCGFEVKTDPEGRVLAELAEKQSAFDMLITRYPHIESTMTRSCRIGCVIAMLNHAKAHTSDTNQSAFYVAASVLFNIVIKRGFTLNILQQGVKRHVESIANMHLRSQQRNVLKEKLMEQLDRCKTAATGEVATTKVQRYLYTNSSNFCWLSVGAAVVARLYHLLGSHYLKINEETSLGKKLKTLCNTNGPIEQLKDVIPKTLQTGQHDPFSFLEQSGTDKVIPVNLLTKTALPTYEHEWTCPNCNVPKYKVVPNGEAFFPFNSKKHKSAEELTDDIFEPSMTVIDEQMCENCKVARDTKNYYRINDLPAVVIVSINRATLDGKKKHYQADIPMHLDARKHLYDNGDLPAQTTLSLQMVIDHIGERATSGHYVINMLHEDNWYNIDSGPTNPGVKVVNRTNVLCNDKASYAIYTLDSSTGSASSKNQTSAKEDHAPNDKNQPSVHTNADMKTPPPKRKRTMCILMRMKMYTPHLVRLNPMNPKNPKNPKS